MYVPLSTEDGSPPPLAEEKCGGEGICQLQPLGLIFLLDLWCHASDQAPTVQNGEEEGEEKKKSKN